MASTDEVKQEYNKHAVSYNDYTLTPHGILETELIDSALGDCAGLKILDLAGGTGVRARQALDHGAFHIDVVDLSPEMLNIGKGMKSPREHRGHIQWLEGDCSKLMEHLPLQGPGTYDIVMANWLFDHAASIPELEGMWRNIAFYLKPGGHFVGARCGDIQAPSVMGGKYGIQFRDWKPIPGGFRYRFRANTTPPLEIEAASMETSYSGLTEMHEKFSLYDVETEPYTTTEVVKQDPEFWQLFLETPYMVVVKAKKTTA